LRKSFNLSRDPKFLEKSTDVVGVYLTPPQNAVVLCVDEKSQIQALDRTQPGAPLKPGRCGTLTHDYKRNGTTTLFAALQMVEGRVIGECYPRHRHQEFLRFLRRLDAEFPDTTELHLILTRRAAEATQNYPANSFWSFCFSERGECAREEYQRQSAFISGAVLCSLAALRWKLFAWFASFAV
jgi:hypothetical protein